MNTPMMAVIDTNVLVAALLTRNHESATVAIVKKIFDRQLIPIVNGEILEEYSEVLARPKFKFNPDSVKQLIESISELALYTGRTPYLTDMPDPKDRVFYEVSLTTDSYLVTGNTKHFPLTPKVVTPAQMLEIMDVKDNK